MFRKWIVGVAAVAAGCALFLTPEDASARCRRAGSWNRGFRTNCCNTLGVSYGYSNNGYAGVGYNNMAFGNQPGYQGVTTNMQYNNGSNVIGTAPSGSYTTGYQPQSGTINSDGTIVNGSPSLQTPNTYAPDASVNSQFNNNINAANPAGQSTNLNNSGAVQVDGRVNDKAPSAPPVPARND